MVSADEARPTSWSSEAYVTLFSGTGQQMHVLADGLFALAASLADSGTQRPLVVMTSSGSPVRLAQRVLRMHGLNVSIVHVPSITNPSPARPGVVDGTAWRDVYTKLQVFRAPYRRVVYLDADTIVLRNIDALFAIRNSFAAVLDEGRGCARGMGIGYANPRRDPRRVLQRCRRMFERVFNSGVMAIAPSATLFAQMMAQRTSLPSADGSDQGFLNAFFNVTHQSVGVLPPRFNGFAFDDSQMRRLLHLPPPLPLRDIDVLHFAGWPKPNGRTRRRPAMRGGMFRHGSVAAFRRALASFDRRCASSGVRGRAPGPEAAPRGVVERSRPVTTAYFETTAYILLLIALSGVLVTRLSLYMNS